MINRKLPAQLEYRTDVALINSLAYLTTPWRTISRLKVLLLVESGNSKIQPPASHAQLLLNIGLVTENDACFIALF